MEVGQGPNWGCSAKEKKTLCVEVDLINTEYPSNQTLESPSVTTNSVCIILVWMVEQNRSQPDIRT
jgi:hypothetical protein